MMVMEGGMQEHSVKNSRPLWASLSVLTLAVFASLFSPWLRDRLMAISTIVIAAATAAYALLTTKYVRLTHEIAEAAKGNLDASRHLSESTERYASLTQDILDATRAKIEAETRPDIGLHAERHGSGGVVLVIENVGLGAARDISLLSSAQNAAAAAKIASAGRRYMPPKQRLRVWLGERGSVPEGYFDPCTVHVKYQGRGDEVYEEDFPLDFSELHGSPALDEIAEVLREIKLTLDRALFFAQAVNSRSTPHP